MTLGAYYLPKKFRKFRLKVKWNSNFSDNPFVNCRLPPEVVLVITWKNGPHLETWFTVEKMGHNGKNGPHLEKKKGHTWKNESHLKRWFTIGKMGINWNNGSLLKKTGCQLEKWVTLRKMVHDLENGSKSKHNLSWKNKSHFKKWVVLWKMFHT